jgi:hypothetical protein
MKIDNHKAESLICQYHNKKVEIINTPDGVDYKFCCQSFRSEFAKIVSKPKKKS